jgi:FixJ family two-component response regulator
MSAAANVEPAGECTHSQKLRSQDRSGQLLARHNLIVVIDNDLAFLESIEELLSSFAYQVEVFESAGEFLSVAPVLEPACLIIDIQLGNISGLELVRALREDGFASPVIFMTGSGNELHRQQAIELGCIAFLVKPFSAEQLIEPVSKAVGSKLN